MIGMFLLKHTYALSDEQVWERWVENSYFQYFTGEEFFQHELLHERSGLSHWSKRISDRLPEASRVHAAALRNSALSLAKASSMGLRSGE